MSKAVRFYELGGPEVLKIEEVAVPEPKEGEVRVKIEAIGLNRAEAMFRRGQYMEQPKFPSGLGVEAAGTVEAVGPGVTTAKVGDRVSVAAATSMNQYPVYAESAIVPAAALLPYPENLTPSEGAAIWVQYLTTYFAFVDVGNLQAGQHVLITAASSSTGLAAVELARFMGAIPIAATRTSAKKQGLLDAGAEAVVVTDEENLAERVMAITNGKGANLIYDPVAGKSLEALANAVAWGGTIIIYGMLDPTPPVYPLLQAFTRNFSLRGYTVNNYVGAPHLGMPRNDEAAARGIKTIYDALASGKLKPVIAKTFKLDDIQDAHRYLESNQQMGKIIVTP